MYENKVEPWSKKTTIVKLVKQVVKKNVSLTHISNEQLVSAVA